MELDLFDSEDDREYNSDGLLAISKILITRDDFIEQYRFTEHSR